MQSVVNLVISIEKNGLHMGIICENIEAMKLLMINGIDASIKRKEAVDGKFIILVMMK